MRQDLKKTVVRETIDLKDFKFPPRPQTPDTTDFAAWIPGSGFHGIQPSTTSTTEQIKRGRQRTRSTGGELQPVARHAFKTNEIRVSEGSAPRRLFGVGNFHNGHHSLNDARLVAGRVTAEEAKTSEERHPLHMTSNNDRQTFEVGHLQSNHQESGIRQIRAEALDKTRSSREGTPRTTAPFLPSAAPSQRYPSVLSDNASPYVETGNAENTAHMDLPNTPPVFLYDGYPHPPSTALSRLPTHDTKPSIQPRPPNHRNLQIPSPYQSYPYPPSSVPSRPASHQSEEKSEDENVEEGSGAADIDPGSEKLDSEEISFEEANEAQSVIIEGAEDAISTNPHGPRMKSPPQSSTSSEAMLEDTWHGIPSSPVHPFQAPTLVTGGYFTTAVERLSSPNKPAQILPPRKTRDAPSMPRGTGLRAG